MADLKILDARIARAWAACIVARDNWARNPSGENFRLEQVAEDMINGLLDERLRIMAADEVVSA